MAATTRPLPNRPGKRRLLESCALAASLIALAHGGPAIAQMQGNVVGGTADGGLPGVVNSGTTTTVTVTGAGSRNILNWLPNSIPADENVTIDMLPNGSTLHFVGTGNYTVLNRFVNGAGGSLANQIALNGTVNSTIGSTTGPRGGNIWFYNAGGILIGDTGVINVGSLILTTNDIPNFADLTPGANIQFRGAANSTAAVTVNGAINPVVANNPANSYVAIVAPRIVQNGTVYVNGSAAYVAAEAADVRINGGLFDISIVTGTDGQAITHTGSTIATELDQNRVYMVAVPKNEAVSMLLSGSIGLHDLTATAAQTNSNGSIVLSAGYNVQAGQITGGPVGTGVGNISVRDTVFLSNLTAHASGTFAATPADPLSALPPPADAPPPPAGRFRVQGDADITGDIAATIAIGPNQQAFVDGNLFLQSNGGLADITITGGVLTTGGALSILAGSAIQGDGTVRGGTARLNVLGGARVDAGGIVINADALGGNDIDGNGIHAVGGTASLLVSGAGSYVNSDEIRVQANARGGGLYYDDSADTVFGEAAVIGGNGTGGTASVTVAADGRLEVNDELYIEAVGYGSHGSGASGTGRGGTVELRISSVTTVSEPMTNPIFTAPVTNLNAAGLGGGDVFDSSGIGFTSTAGGLGRGGQANIVIGGNTANMAYLDGFVVLAGGFGGTASGAGATAGNGQGGAITYTQTGTSVVMNSLGFEADGFGGVAPTLSGNGTGGSVSVDLNGGTFTTTATGISNILSASGVGGAGQSGNDSDPSDVIPAGSGGDGSAGTVRFAMNGTATANINGLTLNARGTGGAGGAFESFGLFTPPMGNGGNGGRGTGNSAVIDIVSGQFTATGGVTVDARGIGGAGGVLSASGSSGTATGVGVGGNGGFGQGGTARVALNGLMGTSPSVQAAGIGGVGGNGQTGGNGGGAAGGLAELIVRGFDASAMSASLNAAATAGNGGNGSDGDGGDGGDAQGGTARMRADGSGGLLRVASVSRNITGTGGAGGNGGAATLATPTSGGAGGNGTGGILELVASNSGVLNATPGSSGPEYLESRGFGGNGGTGATRFGTSGTGGSGGDGGTGSGGDVRVIADGGTVLGGRLEINVLGTRGNGGLGGDGDAGPGAAGITASNSGGTALLHALNGGEIDFAADVVINASGDDAGRIELRSSGSIELGSLIATADGAAAPTTGDIDTAPAGIFLEVAGGTIAVDDDATLTTTSSIGVHGEGAGAFTVGGVLGMDAGDQIEIRHAGRVGNATTIQATGGLIATAAAAIDATSDSLIGTDGNLSVTVTGANGTIDLGRVSANNIFLSSLGATTVEHADATGNFTATVGSFGTGDSIIAGGNINITAPGAVDLGDSTADGSVFVESQTIAFNNVTAGTNVTLRAIGGGTADGIFGVGGITAGENISLNGRSINIGGTIDAGESLSVVANDGDLAIALATAGGNIGVVTPNGNLSGIYRAGGNVNLSAGGNIVAEADAAGTYVDPSSGFASEGYVFVDGDGDVTLTDSSAATMLAVRAGGAASITGGTAGEDIFVLAGTTATLTGLNAGDDIQVQASGGIDISNAVTTGTGPDVRSVVYQPGASVPTPFLQIQTSAPDLSNVILAATAGNIAAANVSAANDVIANASGVFGAAGPVIAGRDIIIGAASLDLAGLATPTGDPIDTLSAGRDLSIISAAGIDGGRLRAVRNLTVDAGTAIDVLAAQGGNVSLTGATGIAAGLVSSAGTTSLVSSNGDIAIGSLSSIGLIDASAQSILVQGGGPLTFATLTTDVGDAAITADAITVTSGNVAGRATLIALNGNLGITSLTADSAALESRGGGMTLGGISVADTLTASALGMMQVNGVVTGRAIALASADIDITSAGRVGTAGVTEALSVENNDNTRQTFVGGTGTRNGYHIDADEMTRLFGTDIMVFAIPVNNGSGLVASAPGSLPVPIASVGSSAQPDVIVDSFTMTGGTTGSNLGPNGSLTISTPGKMRVIGNVQLTGLTDSNALNLSANDALEVILGQGSIRLLDASGAPGGQLNMASDDIIVATLAAITDVGAATTTDAIESRLAQNDGVLSDEGPLFARGIAVQVNGGFYVQNSGAGTAFDQRRGLTFGAGGLDIQTSGPSRIVANGVHLGPSGQVTGLDTIGLLTIGGSAISPTSGNFDPRSTFNGCLIASTVACTFAEIGRIFPIQDVIEEEADAKEDEGDGSSLPTPLITMRDLDPLSGEPLLDDPVTGAGNDDLWTPTDRP